ncbi:hypothetical protein ABPG75_002052 [Micractinium tetrahymenae]
MRARREAKEAAAAAAAAEKQSEKQYLDAVLREYKPRKGGTAKWKKGSKVLVPHTDQYYGAVVVQGQKREDGQWYMVHYEGWSSKYDEWVREDEVVRYDRSLLEQSAAAAGNAPGDLAARRRKADVAPAEPQLAVEIPQQLRLHIPPLLKKVVLDDSEQINLKGMLLPLPRNVNGRPTVNDILKVQAAASRVSEAAREMVAGLRQYFDRCLRHFLLYSHEVQQAEEALGGGPANAAAPSKTGGAAQPPRRPPSDLYGAEHLVRLFVKLPELVPVAYMTPPDVVRLEQALHDLMARMTEVKKQAKYFSLPEEYRRNPHFNHLMALHYQSLLGAGALGAGGAGGGGGTTGAGTPAPASGLGPTRGATPATGEAAAGAAGDTGAAAAAAAAGSRGVTLSGANSEAADMEQD